MTERQAERLKAVISENTYIEVGDIIDYIADSFEPNDIFSDESLSAWVEENGYVKGDSTKEPAD